MDLNLAQPDSFVLFSLCVAGVGAGVSAGSCASVAGLAATWGAREGLAGSAQQPLNQKKV